MAVNVINAMAGRPSSFKEAPAAMKAVPRHSIATLAKQALRHPSAGESDC